MVRIGTMQSRKHPTRWKPDVFTIHRSKLRLYQPHPDGPQDERACRDPADLPQFDATDRYQIQLEMTTCFSDAGTVRHEHVEPRQGDQHPVDPKPGGAPLVPQVAPFDPLEEPLPPRPNPGGRRPETPPGNPPPPLRAKRRRENPVGNPEREPFLHGGPPPLTLNTPPPFEVQDPPWDSPPPPSPVKTFADGLTTGEKDEMLAQWMPEPVPQFPTDAIIADWEYRPTDAPEVHPDDSVSQAGRRLIAPHHDLDVEDYRQDYGLRMSSRKHDTATGPLSMTAVTLKSNNGGSHPPLHPPTRPRWPAGPTVILAPRPHPPRPRHPLSPPATAEHLRDVANVTLPTPCAVVRPETAD